MASSVACKTCKLRRIKCDRDWPTCLRCSKSGRECLRPSSTPLAIVSENKYAAGVTKRPRGPRIRRATAPTTTAQELHSKALKNYFENHVISPTQVEVDVSGSLSACVLAWQNSGHTSRLVELALLSMALAVYGRTKSSPEAVAEAFKTYHELLRLTQDHIARPTLDVASIDACLLTVFLMGRCESTMHNTADGDAEDLLACLKSWSHHDGAMALLKLWHMHFEEAEPSIIVKQTRRGMLKSLLLRRMSVPKWLREGECFGERGFELEYDKILVRLVNVRLALSMDQSLADEISRNGLLDETTKLATNLYSLKNAMPAPYSYREYRTDCCMQPWFQTSTVNVFPTPAHAMQWAHVIATRLIIIYSNMSILQHSAETREEADMCATLLQDVANELASTIPQCIGLVNLEEGETKINTEATLKPSQASSAVWPLTMAASIEGYDKILQQGFKLQLTKLGEIVGDGVLQSVSSDDWPLL